MRAFGRWAFDRVDGGRALLVAAALLTACPTYGQDGGCGFAAAFDRPDENGTKTVHVYEGAASAAIGNRKPLAFVSDLKVNTDGTRISYKVDDPLGRHGAINDIRNAFTNPHRPVSDFEAIRDAGWLPTRQTWSVLSADIIERDTRPGSAGRPCIDRDGYLVSMTADVAVAGGHARVGDCDQSKWIDSLTIPAIVLPGESRRHPSEFSARQATTRHVAIVMTLAEPRRIAFGIVGDKGPMTELGEASVALNRQLRGLPDSDVPHSAKDAVLRFQGGRSIVLVLPGAENRLAYPVTPERVAAFARSRFAAWGGQDRLTACLAEIPDA